jgi:hypothetical protein
MARHIPKKNKAPPASKPADDLSVLAPNRDLPVGGELVTVAEYGFVEGARLQGTLTPFIDRIADLVEGSLLADHTRIRVAFGDHIDAIVHAIAVSIKRPDEWVAGLGDADGELLIDTWWVVNQPFFLRRVRTALGVRAAIRVRSRVAEAAQAADPDGATSSLS